MQTVTDEDDLSLPSIKFEYLDHPADVQLHSWGDTLQESFEQVAMAMFGYITDMDYVDMDHFMDCEVKGDDMLSLLFLFLDELLFNFCADPFFIAKVSSLLPVSSSTNCLFVHSFLTSESFHHKF